jgi:hypothetical protein
MCGEILIREDRFWHLGAQIQQTLRNLTICVTRHAAPPHTQLSLEMQIATNHATIVIQTKALLVPIQVPTGGPQVICSYPCAKVRPHPALSVIWHLVVEDVAGRLVCIIVCVALDTMIPGHPQCNAFHHFHPRLRFFILAWVYLQYAVTFRKTRQISNAIPIVCLGIQVSRIHVGRIAQQLNHINAVNHFAHWILPRVQLYHHRRLR